MPHAAEDRWVEVTPSQFTHEAEGLAEVRKILPDETPFRAWSNFEFRDSHGRWHEVDLLLFGRDTLHLIELKYYSGILRGDGHRWLRPGHRAEDSPLKLARRKAQYFASKLKTELRRWADEKGVQIPDERDVIPFVQESVFLHHPKFRCELPNDGGAGLYGLDGIEEQTDLPGISELVLHRSNRRPIAANQEAILVALMKRIGLVQRREREAGSWIIQDDPVAEGEGWQEWRASHRVAQQEQATIRFQVLPSSAPQEERRRTRQIAEHEYRLMSRLQHDGLQRPRDIVESDELGVGLVYDYDDKWQRLDLWMADSAGSISLATQLSIIRQIGEAMQYAHNNKVVHRGLNPQAIWIREFLGSDDVKVRVGDWQRSGTTDAGHTRSVGLGVTSLARSAQRNDAGSPDGDRAMSEGFEAPEGAWNPDADRIRIDVFGLGAIAFYVLTGQPAASTTQALRARLRQQAGLDVAAQLPQVSSDLRNVILQATRPSPTDRIGDVSLFLTLLAQAERQSHRPTDLAQEVDPLDAPPGAILGGRYRLERRLGQGSTAVGLLVRDEHDADGSTERVLKVALNDDAARRLADEADVLRGLRSPRLVKLIDGPLTIGGRQALVLESAGTETLAEALRTRRRLSYDLLQRYGRDLLDALVALDKAGVDHRDIKPSNLGVRTGRGDRTKHLVLFDFSLTRAAASATSAGTPPYLDPFFTEQRTTFDSAAERYSAAVVLFEMATGQTPRYGDGQADPATIPDEVELTLGLFDASLAAGLQEFFATALAREVERRHHTAAEMRAAWLAIFPSGETTQEDETADQRAAQATLTTPIAKSGLTARALSALEPYAVSTVGELLAVDQVRLSRMPGVANSTRLQITRRIKQWRKRLGDVEAPKAPKNAAATTLQDMAQLLLDTVTTGRARSRGGLVRLILGMGTELDAFATQAQLGAHLDEHLTPGRVSQLFGDLQRRWAEHAESREALGSLSEAVQQAFADKGCVLALGEAVEVIQQAVAVPDPHPDERLSAGLLRLALERLRAQSRVDEVDPPAWRRRDGHVVAIATGQDLLDLAEAAGSVVDETLSTAGPRESAIVPAPRARKRFTNEFPTSKLPKPLHDLQDLHARLVELGAAASRTGGLSATGELHHRDLSAQAALAATFEGIGGQLTLSPDEVRQRVHARFPQLAALPDRPRLDAVLDEAGLGLYFDDRARVYRLRRGDRGTTGIEPRLETRHEAATAPVASNSEIGRRIDQSLRSRSFLTVGVPPMRLGKFVTRVAPSYTGTVVDLTGALIDALRQESDRAGVPWDAVQAADAEAPTSRGGQGLAKLVRASWGKVADAIDAALAEPGTGPVVITEASPLARYGNMSLLTRWSDLGTSRSRAVWLVAPQLGPTRGATLDGHPVPLAAPSQFVDLDTDWIDSVAATDLAASKEL